MNKFFAILGGIVIVALAALFAVPSMVDWSRYRGSLEDEATRLIGRRVRVGEHVRLQLLPSPYISFDNVRVADASGHFDTPLLRADAFRMQLAIGPLLTGSLVAQDIELTSPVLRVAIDADGHGNWLGLGGAAPGTAESGGELSRLALNAVHIERGTFELIEAPGWQSRIEGVTGDLNSPALTGPYRFKGQIASAGKPIDVRLSANREDASGKTRVNVVWHDAAAGTVSYTLNGTLDHLDATPTLTGTVQAQVPPATAGGNAALDAKADITATPEVAKFSGIDMQLDGGARPQHVSGAAELNWRDGSQSHAELAAVWLDLDAIAGADPKAGPLASLRKLIDRMSGGALLQERARLDMRVSEATLGGGSLQDVALVARNSGHGLSIESLAARMPGLSRLDASGELGTDAGGRFDGQVRLWGANLGSLADWAIPGAGIAINGSAGNYLIDGAIVADAGQLRADRLRAEISGTTVTGSFAYASAEPRSLTLSLDSGRLDLAKLLDAPLAGSALSALLLPALAGDSGKPAAGGLAEDLRTILSGDSHLDLRIGHLITAEGGLRDVWAKLDRSNGRLDISAIDLATDAGVGLHVEGSLQTKSETAVGQLRLTLAAPDGNSLSNAAKLAGVTAMPASLEPMLAAITPLSLAGTMQVGGAGVSGEQLRLDGSANGSRAALVLDRDGGDGDPLAAQIDLVADLANADEGRLIAQLGQAFGASVRLPVAVGTGRATLRMSGVPRTGMITSLALDSHALRAGFEGNATLDPAAAGFTFDGAASLDAADASTALGLARLDHLLPETSLPLKLTGTAQRDAAGFGLTDIHAAIGANGLTGQARLDTTAGPPKLTVDLATPVLRLDTLLAVLAPAPHPAAKSTAVHPPGLATAGTGAGSEAAAANTTAAAVPVVAPAASPWSQQAFNFSALAGFSAEVEAKAGRLVLGDHIEATDAQMHIASKPDAVELTLAQGHLGQGSLTGHATLSKETAGAGLTIEARLSDADLGGLTAGTNGLPKPAGLLALTAQLSGHGLSPHDIATAAKGSGEFSLTEGGIEGMSPLTLDTAAHEALAAPSSAANPINAADLTARINKARFLSPFPMLGGHGAIGIADGQMRFDRLKVQSSKADLEIANRVDLASFRLASTFTVTPKPAVPGQTALVPVQFSFEGPLTGFAAVTPAIDVAELTRDLTARKLLGDPEQTAGLWPLPPPAATTATATATATATGIAVPAGSRPAKPPQAAVPADAAAQPAMDPKASGATAGKAMPIDGASVISQSPAASAVPSVAPPAVAIAQAPPPPRPRRKKTNWAQALLQGLFGN